MDPKLLLKALAFAAHKHRDGTRKGESKIPYINHPIAVANILVNEGGVTDSDAIVAAILHDTVEDTETTLAELAREFGEQVATIVHEVSDDKSLAKEERKRRQVEHAPSLSPGARLVKLADKICNVRDIIADPPAGWPLERKQNYFDWAKEVVDQIRGANPQLERLFDEAYAKRPAG